MKMEEKEERQNKMKRHTIKAKEVNNKTNEEQIRREGKGKKQEKENAVKTRSHTIKNEVN